MQHRRQLSRKFTISIEQNNVQLLLPQQQMNTFHKNQPKPHRIGKYNIYYDQILGAGATSTVFKGENMDSKEIVAIKLIDLSQNNDIAQRSLLDNQCKALKLIDHPNLLSLLDIIEQDRKFYIITNIYEGMTLADYILKNTLSQEMTVNIFKKIMEGITYLIDKNILHRDLKPSNIIIDKNMTPIIIDFGFCEIIHQAKISRVFNVGSPSYMAPQAYLRTLYSQKSQGWSLAMILYEMLHKKTLDKGILIKQFFQKIRNVNKFIVDQIDRSLASELKQILEKTFQYNSMDRLSITGMKYLIDRYLLNKKRQGSKKLTHAPSTIEFTHSKQMIKFNQQQVANKNVHFQTVSPLKKRQISIKFIPPQEHKRTISNNVMSKKEQAPRMQLIPGNNPAATSADYFSNKIKKGVFDVKRFSKTQRNILESHSNFGNIQHYPTQHKIVIRQA